LLPVFQGSISPSAAMQSGVTMALGSLSPHPTLAIAATAIAATMMLPMNSFSVLGLAMRPPCLRFNRSAPP
jgi:hypothetical protein